MRIDDPRVSLKLEGRRLDIDSFILSASGRPSRSDAGTLERCRRSPSPIDLDLSLEQHRACAGGAFQLRRLRAGLRSGARRDRAPRGQGAGRDAHRRRGRDRAHDEAGGNGRVAVAAAASDRFLRYLAKLKIPSSFARRDRGRSPWRRRRTSAPRRPVASFRNARFKLGEASVTGTVRFTAPEQQARGKLEAQVGIQGLDLAQLPQIGSLFEAHAQSRCRPHPRRPGCAPRRRARAPAASPRASSPTRRRSFVEDLEVTDLAGANARVSGRIEPDGSGSIAGRVTAKRAAPLVDLIGTVWIGGVSQLVPHFLREGDLELDVIAERAATIQRSTGLRLRTSARGRAAGGLFEAEACRADGLNREASTSRWRPRIPGVWVDRPAVPVLRRPSRLDLSGVRVPRAFST